MRVNRVQLHVSQTARLSVSFGSKQNSACATRLKALFLPM